MGVAGDLSQSVINALSSLKRLSWPRLAKMRFRPLSVLYIVPLLSWLFLFSLGVALIPPSLKPQINVTLLPHLDALFGYSVYWFANGGDKPLLDLLAAVPYTIHPILPVLYLMATCAVSPKQNHLRFVFVFGLLNLTAVLTHLMFPTAPPWYWLKYGTQPASYSTKGDPAVLARLDERYAMSMYHKMYAEGGKVVFGAWPSLHAAWPYLMARFQPGVPYKVVKIWQWVYVGIVWWAAVYLQHHWFVDILGGVLYAEAAYWVGRRMGRESVGLPVYVKR